MTEEWFLEERGIQKTTLDAFGVRLLGNEVVFPYPTGEKYRYFNEDGKRQFRFTKGMKPSLFGPRPPEAARAVFICEGETDTMRLWQELKDAADLEVGVMGLGGVDTWRKLPDYEKQGLNSIEQVYVVLDNDEDYNVQAQVDAVWLEMRKFFGPKAKRIRLPDGIKDICEFFSDGYDVPYLRQLAKKGRQVSRFSPIDFSVPPKPVNWLWDGWIARGDVTLLSGPSGLGKSWVLMALAQAVCDGTEILLGRTVYEGGRALLVDEENPEDVVRDRLVQLGLEHHGNLRYIWNNGIRLDRNPDELLEETLDYQPILVGLDSLTRIHSKEENNAGEMAPLLNDGIRPLARESGAAVVLIHHHDKAGNGPRGSGDIMASVDAAIDIRGTHEPGTFVLKLVKSRRRLTGAEIYVKIVEAGGRIDLQATDPRNLAF